MFVDVDRDREAIGIFQGTLLYFFAVCLSVCLFRLHESLLTDDVFFYGENTAMISNDDNPMVSSEEDTRND